MVTEIRAQIIPELTRLQFWWRAQLVRLSVNRVVQFRTHAAASLMQAMYRAHVAYVAYPVLLAKWKAKNASIIQSWSRGLLTRRWWVKEAPRRRAALLVQRMWRGTKVRLWDSRHRFAMRRAAATKLQRVWRGRGARLFYKLAVQSEEVAEAERAALEDEFLAAAVSAARDRVLNKQKKSRRWPRGFSVSGLVQGALVNACCNPE